MIAWFGAYAIARSSDLKWGNRPDSTESSGAIVATAQTLVAFAMVANLFMASMIIWFEVGDC
jgi:hypothetical protein